MVRVLELIALLAPIAGAIVLIRYRKRSRPAFVCGIFACVMGLVASGIGLFGQRFSIVSAFTAGDGAAGVMERLDSLTLIRFGLLVAAGALLVVAALIDRRGAKPVGWISGGLLLLGAGIGLHFLSIDMGEGHERLMMIVGVLVEVAQAALLGAGFLVLCVAAVAHRAGNDGRRDPSELAARLGARAWRLYSDSRRGTDR